MTVWTLVFLLLFVLLYLNQIGLPDFIKRPVLQGLRDRGVDVEFKNLRLSWYRGLVAYNVRFGQAQSPDIPQVTAERVQLSLKGSKLWQLDLQVGGLSIHQARVTWPLDGTNEFALEKVNADVSFLPDDLWSLNNLELETAGATIRVSGVITNASALRSWKLPSRAKISTTNAPPRERTTVHTKRFSDAITKLKFKTGPVIRMDFSIDARNEQPLLCNIRVRLEDGGFIAQAALSPNTGDLNFAVRSDFDLQKIRPILPEKADAWIGRYSWEKPPQIRAVGGIVLPTLNSTNVNWRDDVLPTLRLDGEFKVGAAAFRGVPITAAKARVVYLNSTWHLQDMKIDRPEGSLLVEHWTEENTRDYYWRLRGVFDPEAVRPLLDPPQQRGLDMVKFTTPPKLDLEIWSRWYERERTGIKGRVALSNFTFRGESVQSFNSAVEYSNLWLRLIEPRLTRGEQGEQLGKLDGVAIDFGTQMLYLTNGFSTLAPMSLAHAIGKKTTHTLEPYQFLTPPTAHVSGSVNIGDSHIADLHINLAGGPFRWWKFNLPYISGNVIWSNQSLLLTNVNASFYSGNLDGWAGFDFTPAEGDNFKFDMTVTNAELAGLLPDLGGKSNELSGKITGRLVVTDANTKDMQSWQGYGHMNLEKGLLWEIPVFGFFAPVLNTVYPNLGSGRASDGSATYTISNSVIITDNLQLRSPAMRMQYRGTVDFEGNLNARAEAELLRNTTLIGPVVSTMLWPFTKLLEYKVSGSLGRPVAEPVHIPKALLFPLHPYQSLKGLFSPSPNTNSPARFEPVKTND